MLRYTAFALAVSIAILSPAVSQTPKAVDVKVNQQTQQPVVSFLPVDVKQLPTIGGVVPVELSCSDAELSSPRSIEKLACTFKNNTERFIAAVSLYIIVNLERNGKISELSSSLTLDSDMYADFGARIPPGAQYPIRDLPSSYSDVVKSISAGIDYVDFGDDKPLGPNAKGFEIIRSRRNGASKYKVWLIDKYTRNGKSIEAVMPLLNAAVASQELGLTNTNEQNGAEMFRMFLLRQFQTYGPEKIMKLFK
jgi:hypothetical protein